MKAVAQNAPYGQFLNDAEAAALSKGRELIRQSLETIAQEEIDDSEKKETKMCPKCQTKKRHRGYRNKNVDTAAGTVKLKRRYDECPPCNLPEHAVDEPLGITDYTVGFRSLAVRAGGGRVQEYDWSAIKADGNEVESAASQPDDGALCLTLRQRLEPILENSKIDAHKMWTHPIYV